MKPFSISTIILLFLFFNPIGFSQNLVLSNEAKVSVLTCGTGNESYSLFGHTAVRVADSSNGLDIVYNFGAFDFGTSNFVLKFTKGDLKYFAVAHSFADFMAQYTYEKRSVFEQELAIPLGLKQKIFENLNRSLQLENREYTYKFIDKNCTSMVVDIINTSLNGDFVNKKTDTDISYRTILYPYFENHFYEKLGTSIIFGTKVDQMGTQLFLPFELKKSLDQLNFQQHPIVKENKTLIEFEPETPFSWWNSICSYLLLLGIIIVLNQKAIDLGYLVVMGVLGCFFVFIGWFSQHQELSYNYNVLLFNPILLALVYFYRTQNTKWTIYLQRFYFVCLGIYLLLLVNKAHLWIVFPLIASSFVVVWRRFK